jgi:hypothetical protein
MLSCYQQIPRSVKLTVIYLHPKDVAAVENTYQPEHVPLAVSKLAEQYPDYSL